MLLVCTSQLHLSLGHINRACYESSTPFGPASAAYRRTDALTRALWLRPAPPRSAPPPGGDDSWGRLGLVMPRIRACPHARPFLDRALQEASLRSTVIPRQALRAQSKT